MLLSRKFVSDYIDLPDVSIKQIAEDMTGVGNEYDKAGKLIDCTNLIVGEVISCENHPDSDHLHVCKVDIGSEILDIVCGAPNVKKGIKVIVAMVGAILPGGEIKAGKIRDEVSNGMLCSLAELGLDNKFLTEEDKKGIHILNNDIKVGSDPIKALGLDDEVIDFELTSNRGDLLSILGMAYELGAIYNKKVKDIDLSYNESKDNIKDNFNIKIDTEDCSLFLAKKVKNIVIKESPDFIKKRLIASGIRPINNVVDISNYVMLELGQPLHYYDANKLGSTLIVRNALEDEKLTTLDGIERSLSKDDIVISNNSNAVGLAGVMGGLSTEVDNNTTDIIIEAAIFDNVKIRKTSKKTLRSEASNRFEKGLDPKRTYMAVERSCNLLEKYADATIVSGMLEHNVSKVKDKTVDITVDKINKILGLEISKEEIISILESLGFKVTDNNNYLTVTVESRRLDINIEEDLVEEVGRVYGIDNIKGRLPVLSLTAGTKNNTKREIRNKMINLGLNETLSYTLIPNSEVHKYTNDFFEEIMLNDPMSEDRNTLRYSLIYSLKEIYNYNKARNIENISIFEIGKGFYKKETYKEELKLACLMSGDYITGLNKEKVDFYIIKGILESLLDYLGFKGRYSLACDNLPKEIHPKVGASIIMQGQNIGIIGKLHPSISKDNIFVFEINLDQLLSNRASRMSFKEIPKYPSIKKDLAFIIDKKTPVFEIEKTIKKAGGRLLKSFELFDLYEGDNIDENKKSVAYSLEFQDMSKTLTDEEIAILFNKIIKDVCEKNNAVLRDK